MKSWKHGEAGDSHIVNWAKEQKLGFGESPSVRALRAIQRIKAHQDHDQQMDVVMDS